MIKRAPIHTVITDKSERLSGNLILADGRSTSLLVGTKVTKLDGSSGRVIRETELTVTQPPDEPQSRPRARPVAGTLYAHVYAYENRRLADPKNPGLPASSSNDAWEI
ncbi:hypothetical protein CCL09_06620 [Pseudomonas congelans]|nr:hypothetical protein CCL09_06620 [Pseudomonas congelans]